jgi:zinc transporter ZupT
MSVDIRAALAFAAMTFFSTLAGGITALHWPGRVQALMGFAGGVVLAAAFFDLLPDAIQQASKIDMSVNVPLGLALIGYLAFHLLDHFVHRHPAGGKQSAAGLIGARGLRSTQLLRRSGYRTRLPDWRRGRGYRSLGSHRARFLGWSQHGLLHGGLPPARAAVFMDAISGCPHAACWSAYGDASTHS